MKVTLKILSYVLIILSTIALLGLVLDPSGDPADALIELGIVGLIIAHGILTLVYINQQS